MATKIPEHTTLAEAESMLRVWMAQRALKIEKGHHIRAAERLGIHRNTISRILGGEMRKGKGKYVRDLRDGLGGQHAAG